MCLSRNIKIFWLIKCLLIFYAYNTIIKSDSEIGESMPKVLHLFLIVSLTVTNYAVSTEKDLIIQNSRSIREQDAKEVSPIKNKLLELFKTIKRPLDADEKQAAYALVLSEGTHIFSEVKNHDLQEIANMATPKRIDDNFYYIQIPVGTSYVVIEKIIESNHKKWLEYAEHQYDPYMRLGNLKKKEVEEALSQDDQWMKYHLSNSGSAYFSSILTSSLPQNNDLWVAYVTSTNPEHIVMKRKEAPDIDPSDIDMSMTVQTADQAEYYSPMGISISVEGAKKRYIEELSGAMVKPDIPSSIFLHVLACKLIQTKYESVKYLYTTPVHSMARILAKALHPNNPENLFKMNHDTPPVFSWYHSVTIPGGRKTTIQAKNLLNCLFPYKESKDRIQLFGGISKVN